MELSPLLIYFIGQLKAFDTSCGLITLFGGGTLVIFNIIKSVSYCSVSNGGYGIGEYRRLKFMVDKLNKVLGPIVLVAFLGITFLPSRSTVAAMIVVPAVVNNAQVQNISQGALRWAEEYIKNQLELEVQKATKVK